MYIHFVLQVLLSRSRDLVAFHTHDLHQLGDTAVTDVRLALLVAFTCIPIRMYSVYRNIRTCVLTVCNTVLCGAMLYMVIPH